MLTALYNAADVYLSTSAEGFGLTVAEAIACGTPAVGLDYSAVPEVIGPAGLLAPVAYLVDNEYDHAWAAVHEPKFGEAVATLLDDEPLRKRLGRAGPDHVRAMFDWDRAALAFAGIIADRVRLAA
jgi:alpha-1,3-rhamnosyl/mannosyltransferase